ncbi:MAG: hypothetical protein IJ770_04725 [Alphaproteobacteria bacterium]|nr:hypothetical protein [Alphaproteobacteria bacterium]
MQTSGLGNIFYYDNHQGLLSAFADMYDHQSYKTFGTDNIYQLLRYARIIPPDVMIFNLQNRETPAKETFESFENKTDTRQFPIIVLKSGNESFTPHPRIAHYLHLPQDFAKLADIVESYGVGQKTPQFMLLDSYSENSDALHDMLNHGNYTYFEVHNIDAAARYLRKNNPQNVLIEYTPQFISARHTLPHQRIFYVDRHQLNAEIEKFLH